MISDTTILTTTKPLVGPTALLLKITTHLYSAWVLHHLFRL